MTCFFTATVGYSSQSIYYQCFVVFNNKTTTAYGSAKAQIDGAIENIESHHGKNVLNVGISVSGSVTKEMFETNYL